METQKPKTIIIKNGKIIHRVGIRDLLYIQCVDYLSTFFIEGGIQYSCSKSLSYYTDLLGPYQFIRINRNILVNIDHVAAIKRGENNRKIAIMSDSSEHEVAFRRWKNFKNALKAHDIHTV